MDECDLHFINNIKLFEYNMTIALPHLITAQQRHTLTPLKQLTSLPLSHLARGTVWMLASRVTSYGCFLPAPSPLIGLLSF